MSESQASTDEVLQALYTFAAEEMRAGKNREQVEMALMEKGVDRDSATTIAGNLFQYRAQLARQSAFKNIIAGALWCVGGIAVTAVTYNMASSGGGGRYVIAWGAVVFGGLQFMAGLLQLAKYAVLRR